MEQYCVPYEQNEIDYFFDATWKAARYMGLMANICGGVTMIIAFCLSCMSMPKMFLNFTTFLSAAAGFFQCLTFIAFLAIFAKITIANLTGELDRPLVLSLYIS